MKKILGLLLLASMVLFAGCHDDKDEFIPEKPDVPEVLPDDGKVTLTVGVPETLINGGTKSCAAADGEDASRVEYQDESLGFTWQTGDQIAVLSFNGSAYLGTQELTLKSGEGTSKATFEALKVKNATRYTLYYKSANLSVLPDGTASMKYDGQKQLEAASTDHLRDYLWLQDADVPADTYNKGNIDLKLANSIMCFSVKAMKADVGLLKSIEWVSDYEKAKANQMANANESSEAHSLLLELSGEAVKDNTLTAYFCFNPDSMQVPKGATTGLIFNGGNLYHVFMMDADGREFKAGCRYETVVTTKPEADAISDWKRIQTVDEIWVKTVNEKPEMVLDAFKPVQPVLDTEFWCYEELETNPVTTIGNEFFKGMSELTAISLPKAVTAVGDEAFVGCSSLKELYLLPDEPCTLGKNLFEGVSTEEVSLVLRDFFLPQIVGSTWLGKVWKDITLLDAYGNEVSIAPVKSEIWVRTAGDAQPPTVEGFATPSAKDAYFGYWRYTSAVEVTKVPDGFFGTAEGKEVITEIFLPEGITAIGEGAFEGCTKLTKITLPATLLIIGKNALKGCSQLTELVLPEKLTTLEAGALEGCAGLKELVLPEKLSSVGANAITTKLEKLTVKAAPGLKVDADAFGAEKVLPTELKLIKSWYTASVGKPEGNIWMGYTWGEVLFVTADGEIVQTEQESSEIWFTTVDNVRPTKVPEGFSLSKNLLMNKYWCFKSTDGKAISALPGNAFAGLPVTSVLLPEEVKSTGEGAFKGCTALKSIELPAALTTIGAATFEGCTALEKVYFPASVKEIGKAAFKDCSSMTFLSYPEQLTSLGEEAFMGCSKIQKLKLPKEIVVLPASTFEGCSSLEELIVPEGFVSFGNKSLKGCDKLEKYIIPASVTNIGSEAFACKLTKLTVKAAPGLKVAADAFGAEKVLPTELNLLDVWYTATVDRPLGNVWMGYTWRPVRFVTADGEEVQTQQGKNEIWFSTVGNARPTKIPAGFTLSDKLILGKYWSLKAIDGQPVTAVSAHAFAGLPVTEVLLPDGVITIGDSAFKGCSSLTGIELPAGVTTLGPSAFEGCSSLKTMHLPEGLITLGAKAFLSCSGLEAFSGKFATADGRALVQGNTLLTFAPAGASAYTLPSNITTIAPYTFYGSQLETVSLPDGLKEVGALAFANSPKLRRFEGKMVKEDGRFVVINRTLVAFAPAGTTSFATTSDISAIAPQVLSGCNQLTSITLRSWITEIGDRAFEGCSKVNHVTIHAGSRTQLGNDIFGTEKNLKIRLALDYTWAHFTSPVQPVGNQWNDYTWQNIFIINEPIPIRTEPAPNEIWVKTIGADVVTRGGDEEKNKKPKNTPRGFKDAVRVYGQDFWSFATIDGEPVLKLINELFKDATDLIDIYLPNKLVIIEKNVFDGCNKVKQITMQIGITSIGEGSFKGCGGLGSITIPEGVTDIGKNAFEGCTSLTEVIVPEGVENLGDQVFKGCSNLEKVELPTTLEKVEPNILEGCDKVEEVKVPGTNTIEKHAFANLKSLKRVEIDEGVDTIKTEAFVNCESLTAVILPTSIKVIETDAFKECKGVQKLVVKAPYIDTINKGSFANLIHENIFLYLNKDWLNNPASQGIDKPNGNLWQEYEWKGIGDIISTDVEIENPGNSENGFQ